MLKLDGFLRANPPALTATGAFGHIVFKGSSVILINKIQCRRWTIFHAGQAAVAVIIYTKIRHKGSPCYKNNSKKLNIFVNSNIEIRNSKQYQNTNVQNSKQKQAEFLIIGTLVIRIFFEFRV